MNFEHMYDDALTRMKQAIDNSYIILLCINQQYYESDYCRLGNVMVYLYFDNLLTFCF